MSKHTLHLPADAEGPRGISTEAHGDVLLAPGDVREDLTLTDDELDRAKSNGIKSGKPKGADDKDEEAAVKPLAKMNRAELDAANAALPNPITFADDATNKDRAAAIQKAQDALTK